MDKEFQVIKRAILLIAALVLLLVIGALSVMLERYLTEQQYQNNVRIYGTWIEVNVPKHARDRFRVSEEGVYIEERIVDTDYKFNGWELRYHFNGEEYIYKVKNEETTEMQRVAPLHYESLFHLEGSEPKIEEVSQN